MTESETSESNSPENESPESERLGSGLPDVQGVWTRAQLETFLEEALVPIRLGCHHPSGGLWMVSLWYQYRDGRFYCATGRDSNLAAFLRHSGSVSFEVSTNSPPYMGVRGKGVATLEADEDKQLLGTLLTRYLGGTDSALASSLLTEEREELAITVEPARLYTWDFTSRMTDTLENAPAVRRPEPDSPR